MSFGVIAGCFFIGVEIEPSGEVVIVSIQVVEHAEDQSTETRDAQREEGVPIGSVSVCSFRPFPLAELRAALGSAERVVVVEKDLALGLGGIAASNVRMSLRGSTSLAS